VLRQPGVQAALKKHYGISDTNLVMVGYLERRHYGSEGRSNQAFGRPLCFVRTDPTDQWLPKPIEGIRAGRRSEHHER